MKIRLLLTLLGAAALTVSCIKDEPLNAEADIIECTVPGDIVKTDERHLTRNVHAGLHRRLHDP